MTCTVHILQEKKYSRNSEALVFPLHFNNKRLRARGLRLGFHTQISPQLYICDVLCVSSKFFSSWWINRGGMDVIGFLIAAKKRVPRVIWFDVSDSTGATHFKVLPYVDLYCKNQLLKNRALYKNSYYGTRIFTDFIHRQFGIQDADPGQPHLNQIPTNDELRKVQVGWNYGLAHYGFRGELLGKLWHYLSVLPRWYPQQWQAPSLDRSVPLSCRIGTSYSRNTVAFPRQEMKRMLQGKIPTGRISRRVFMKELTQSIAALSPFGYGEVCYRDFELAVCGVAMVKQDMSHLETWPDLWTADSYLPFAWDFSDFEQKIEYALQHPQDMVKLARNAQERYRKVLCTEEGQEEFCERFVNIIKV